MNKRIQLSSSVPSVKPFEGKDLKNLKERKLNPIKKNDAEIVTSIVNRNQARLEKLNCLDNFAKIEPIQLSKENNFYANLNKSHSDYNTQEAIDRVNRLNQMDSNYSDNKMDQIILSVTKGHTEIESIKSVLFEIEKFINNLNSKHSENLKKVLSPLQFATIIKRKIIMHISILENSDSNLSPFITLYISKMLLLVFSQSK
ncbi:hypothetical protein A3Q56_05817 [Intoshia linei]|uniref:Uncharacterized protein n=1 Tax=Intoshia linei TaxID=1819745 RepID=A0A177AWR5_9BILA|nr:hypothetical protein A3Q56_05817 [Intoshia linei]